VALPREEEAQPMTSYRTANFVVEAPTRRVARLVGEAAERERKAQALRWLGQQMPDWPEPCPVKVTLTTAGSGSATSFKFDHRRVTGQSMQQEGTLDGILANSLPHEVTHTIFAHYFRAPIPRWADEGGAMLSESDEEQQRHEQMLWKVLDTPDRLIPLRRLLPMMDYPKDVTALYAEGYSLTRFLVGLKDRRTFLEFVKQGEADGWDKAARIQYNCDGVWELEEAWLADVRGRRAREKEAADEAAGEPRLIEEIGPQGPTRLGVALARVDDEGRLVVRQQEHFHQKVTTYRPAVVVSYQDVSREQVRRFGVTKVAAVRVTGGGTEELKATELAELLRKETPVLVVPDCQSLDPLFAKVAREGTIILTLLQSAVPPPAPPR
jgi:hypothetical protein